MPFEVKIPSLGESVTEATIGTWMRKDGDAVAMDEPILELESDKANMELVAECAGTLKLLRPEGEVVSVGDVVATIEEGASSAAAPTPAKVEAVPEAEAAPTREAATEPEAAPASESPTKPLSPAVRRIVVEEKIDPSTVKGTGPGGRITKGDVLEAATKPGAEPKPAPLAKAAPAPVARQAAATPTTPAGPDEERVPMSRLRQVIAKRLVEAQHVAAILTTFNEVDMTSVMSLRKQYKDDFKAKHGVSLGFMSFFVKACCAAAAEVPELNAQIDGTDLVYRKHVHMGVAVGTERGLVVPVVRNVDDLSFAGVEQEIGRLAGLARDNRLSIENLSGATFTISNGGVYGSLLSTPILTPPQSGILGMHKIEKRPIVVDDQIVIRPMMYLALSYDHRIVDGQGAVTFLIRVKEALEDPARLLLSL
ncbi:MAG: 2-oxoglutarate dehydrogenase complex dihydrolipoyllysine-residue succinyltransferase [Candidatus Binatia bacterium]|nr:2-oxoglutarate dehydrogenase complex dihydrolipoyllysine-residue succinyltransferase [Candidatus Binatia bacterium]